MARKKASVDSDKNESTKKSSVVIKNVEYDITDLDNEHYQKSVSENNSLENHPKFAKFKTGDK